MAARARAAGCERLVLTGIASDQLLASSWPQLARGETASGFDAVVAPAWSVYDDDPRLEHLYALKQAALVTDALARRGQAVVPTLHWDGVHDLDRQLAWLERCGGREVAVDCSTLLGRERWLEVRAALLRIRDWLPDSILHVQGPASLSRLQDLAQLQPVVVYSSRLAGLARARRYLDYRLSEKRGPDDPGECLMLSLESVRRQLEA